VKGVDEELKDLPEPLVDQLRIFEGDGPDKMVPAQKVDAAAPKDDAKPDGKAEGKVDPKATEKPVESESWTLQLVATSDATEAKKVTEKAKAAGFTTTTLKEKGQIKVRLAKSADRVAIDKTAEKLKKAGFKPFAVKAE
jgi:cell division septation protein DedD